MRVLLPAVDGPKNGSRISYSGLEFDSTAALVGDKFKVSKFSLIVEDWSGEEGWMATSWIDILGKGGEWAWRQVLKECVCYLALRLGVIPLVFLLLLTKKREQLGTIAKGKNKRKAKKRG